MQEWMEHPLTLRLISKLKEHKLAHEEAIKTVVLSKGSQLKDQIDELLTLRAQVYTFEYLEDLEGFIEEETTDEI